MAIPLFKSLITSGIYYVLSETVLRGEQSRRVIKNVVVGLLVLLIAASMWLLALVLCVLGIFFQVSGNVEFIKASLISAGIAALVGMVLGIEGVRLVMKRT